MFVVVLCVGKSGESGSNKKWMVMVCCVWIRVVLGGKVKRDKGKSCVDCSVCFETVLSLIDCWIAKH